uniref:Purple acid phosphatase n=1 Tax=Salix viminalis TaxID=40686 RepID=A0A6N2KAZ2_SALVM
MDLFLVLMITSFGLGMVSTHAELQRFEQPAKTDGKLSFLVLGDWGEKGDFNQSEVAHQMGRIGEKLDVDFVVSTGDNFYDDGLTGEQDKAFEESFTQIYTAKSLQKQWYSVLGNHDYRGNVEAQLGLHLRKIDSRWLCLRSFIVNAVLAEIFFVDTTPFVKSYFTDAKGHTYDWRGIGNPRAYIANLIKDLKVALRESSAKWKIVANNVDFYMNGHDHCLEHISDTESPLQFLTSGAGSKAWRGDIKEQKTEGLKFFYDGQGFMSVQLTRSKAEMAFYDVSGNVLHRWNSTKLLYSSI